MHFTSNLWCHKLLTPLQTTYNLLFLCSLWYPTSVGYAVTTDWHTAPSEGTLHVARVTKHSLEGEFYNEKINLGIQFRSQGSPASSYLSIMSLDGHNIFSSALLGDGVTLTSVMGGDYLITGDPKGGKPSAVYHLTRTAMKSTLRTLLKFGISPERLVHAGYLSMHGVTKASAVDFQDLWRSKEAKLIHQTALELGKRGLYGIDSSGTMIFYTLAMRIAQSTSKPISVKPPYCKVDPGAIMKLIQFKISAAQRGLSLCDNNRRYCKTCSRGNECTGACGVGCDCWEMVCGDCCYHRGCLGHNTCSCREGQASFNCFNVFGFQCDSTYRCQEAGTPYHRETKKTKLLPISRKNRLY